MRKIKKTLIDKLINGTFKQLFDYIKTDKDLRLEIRNNDAYVYYLKGIILKIRRLEVDEKYGNVPNTELAKDKPQEYFTKMKKAIDNWLINKNRGEFETQQKIAQINQGKEDKYIILDMEYAFDQRHVVKEKRVKRSVLDLLGIERKTGKIVFFEIKRGVKSLKGRAGIQAHINDFKRFFPSENAEYFKQNLITDIENIVKIKKKLGLIKNFDLPNNLKQFQPELVFVFHPDKNTEIDKFKKELGNEYKVIIVKDNDYKLT